MNIRLRSLIAIAVLGVTVPAGVWTAPAGWSADFVAVPATRAGSSPDGLGGWNVHYERVGGSDVAIAETINGHIEDTVDGIVQQATWDGSTRRTWTYDAIGTMRVTSGAVSEVFVAQYDTAEPNMPVQSVAGIVCDRRTGAPVGWGDLFVDKQAGLIRLGDETAAALAATAAPEHVRDWRRQGQFAPVDINFRVWLPTPEGIELHFPEFQFGRGLKVITVPWSKVTDLIRPELASLMS